MSGARTLRGFRYGQRLCIMLGCAATWLLLGAVAEACPSCRDGLAQGPQANMVRGVFYSILFMMSMPFLICGGLVAYFYFLIRRAKLQGTIAHGATDSVPATAQALAQAPSSDLAVSSQS